jgi:hypothetical protein
VIPLNEPRIQEALEARIKYQRSPAAYSPQLWLVPEARLTMPERIEYDRRWAEHAGLPAPVLREGPPVDDSSRRTPDGKLRRPVPMSMRPDPDDDDVLDLTEFDA